MVALSVERVQVSEEKVWALVVSSVGRALVSGEEWALAALSVERVQISGEMG